MKKSFFCVPIFLGALFLWAFVGAILLQVMNFIFNSQVYTPLQILYLAARLLPLTTIFALLTCFKKVIVWELNIPVSLAVIFVLLALTVGLLLPVALNFAKIELPAFDFNKLISSKNLSVNFTAMLLENITSFLTDINTVLMHGTKAYFLFVSPIFLAFFLYSVTIYCTNWKMLNVVLLLSFTLASFYAYSFLKTPVMISYGQEVSISADSIVPAVFTLIAAVFLIYTICLVLIRVVRKNIHKKSRGKYV